MKQNEHQAATEHYSIAEQNDAGDSAVDAIAAVIIVVCIAAMGLLWVSGQ